MIFFTLYSPCPPLPRSHPLASFYPAPFLCCAVARTASSSSWHTPLRLPAAIRRRKRRRGGPGRRGGRSWGIVVIIIQMRRAKLELCPSPSGWLTVTNSSLIHPNHQLYTGQRRPERQGEAECIPTAAPRLSPSHRRPPSVSVRQEAARHRACSRCCSARTSWIWPCGSG